MKKKVMLISCLFLTMLGGCTTQKKEEQSMQKEPTKSDKIILPKQQESLNAAFSKDKDNTIYFSRKEKIYTFVEGTGIPELKVFYTERATNTYFQSVQMHDGVLYALISKYNEIPIIGQTGLYYYNNATEQFELMHQFSGDFIATYMHFYDNDLYVDMFDMTVPEKPSYYQYKFSFDKMNNKVNFLKELPDSYLIDKLKNEIEELNNIELRTDYLFRNFKGEYSYMATNTLIQVDTLTSSEVKWVAIDDSMIAVDIIGDYIYVYTSSRNIYRYNLDLTNRTVILEENTQ